MYRYTKLKSIIFLTILVNFLKFPSNFFFFMLWYVQYVYTEVIEFYELNYCALLLIW